MTMDEARTPLRGTRWRLERYGPADGPITPVRDATATFDEWTIHGTTGCNRYTAAFIQDGEQFTVSSVATTKMYCAGVMEQERALVDALRSARSLTLAGGRLIIAYAGGALEFVADLPSNVALDGVATHRL